MDPREPSAYTTVDRALSTSAAILSGSSGISAGEVASAVWNESAGNHTDPGTVGYFMNNVYDARLTLTQQAALSNDLPLVRKMLKNRLELCNGSSNNWILYDDDNVSILQVWNITDVSGSAIAIGLGVPSRRSPV